MSLMPQPSAVMPEIREWWSERAEENWSDDILAALDGVSLDAIARRHAVSRASLVAIAESDPSACAEMIRMMRALNIDPAEAAGEAEFSEMAGNCAGCPDKERCRGHLADGNAPAYLGAICANAEALNAMRARPHLLDRS